MIKHLSFLFLAVIAFNSAGYSQDYFRIQADITVKISSNDGTKSLTKATVYYDKNIKELIYDISFPRKEKWLSKDTSLYKYQSDTLIQRVSIPSINEFTVFHLALNAGLKDFGLKNTNYNMSKVEKQGDRVVSYWKIPRQLNLPMDHVVIAKKDNKLESVIIVGENEEIMSKQFFKDYIKIDAFEFPGQIIQVLYDDSGNENYQVTEFSNIIVNDMANDHLYHFKL